MQLWFGKGLPPLETTQDSPGEQALHLMLLELLRSKGALSLCRFQMVFGGTGEDHGVQVEMGLLVFQVFYHMDPSDVRSVWGSYGEALLKHQRSRYDRQIERWREALSEVANLSAWDLRDR